MQIILMTKCTSAELLAHAFVYKSRSISGSPWREDATGNFDMQHEKFRPDRSHLGLGCMARCGRDAPTAGRFRRPMLANTGASSGRFMRLDAFRIEWESSAAGRVMLRARNSQKPTASATTRLPALHAFPTHLSSISCSVFVSLK